MPTKRRITVNVIVRRQVRITRSVRATYQVPRVAPAPVQQTVTIPARTTTRIIRTEGGGGGPDLLHIQPPSPEREWDVFVCHATENKPFVNELAAELEDLGVRLWVDAAVIRLGDSIRQQIDYGLTHSRFGIVVLSHEFFATKKKWTATELDALVALEEHGRQRILPIWLGLKAEDVVSYAPTVAGKLAARTSDATVRQIAEEIAALIRNAS